MANDIRCPFGCYQRWKKKNNVWKTIQHHLYMNHGLEVIESHRVAREIAEGRRDKEVRCES
jgi:hypothetical protein